MNGTLQSEIATGARASVTREYPVVVTYDEGRARIGCFTPYEVHEVVAQLIEDGYAPHEIDWEVA